MGLFKSKEEKAEIAAARAVYAGIGTEALRDPPAVRALAAALQSNASLRVLSDRERRSLSGAAFARYAEAVLADDILSQDEEAALMDLGSALGVDQESLQTTHRPILNRLVVAQVNDGRLSVLESPELMTKKDEVVHLETGAILLKEVAIREYRGASRGVSFRIAKGVRYHVGGTRGRSEIVDTELQEADAGLLSISSKRAVFMGTRKSVEFAYPKLLNIDVFTDGLRFHVSNRQTAHLFRVDSGDVIAATLNAAVQRLEE